MDRKHTKLYNGLFKSLNEYEQAFGSRIKGLAFDHGTRGGIVGIDVKTGDLQAVRKSAKAIPEKRIIRSVSRIEKTDKCEIVIICKFVRRKDGTISRCNISSESVRVGGR